MILFILHNFQVAIIILLQAWIENLGGEIKKKNNNALGQVWLIWIKIFLHIPAKKFSNVAISLDFKICETLFFLIC